jgi:hypothetical protein
LSVLKAKSKRRLTDFYKGISGRVVSVKATRVATWPCNKERFNANRLLIQTDSRPQVTFLAALIIYLSFIFKGNFLCKHNEEVSVCVK